MRDEGTIAAIDCGTNSTRLLIVDAAGATVTRQMRITRLGQEVDATHRLNSASIARTLDVLDEYRTLMDAQPVHSARLVATSAVRDATNGDEFLRPASKMIGVEAELLSGDEEGRLSYIGATADLEPGRGQCLVLDIGGGSTEMVMEHNGEIHVVSLELGCVRLTERSLSHDPPTFHEVKATVEFINEELDRAVLGASSFASLREGDRLIGLAGTVSTLAVLELGLVQYDRERVHHAVLDRTAVERWCHDLARERSQDRSIRPGMLEGRQDVIVGGALVLREVMRRFDLSDCLVSESDILDGMVISQY